MVFVWFDRNVYTADMDDRLSHIEPSLSGGWEGVVRQVLSGLEPALGKSAMDQHAGQKLFRLMTSREFILNSEDFIRANKGELVNLRNYSMAEQKLLNLTKGEDIGAKMLSVRLLGMIGYSSPEVINLLGQYQLEYRTRFDLPEIWGDYSLRLDREARVALSRIGTKEAFVALLDGLEIVLKQNQGIERTLLLTDYICQLDLFNPANVGDLGRRLVSMYMKWYGGMPHRSITGGLLIRDSLAQVADKFNGGRR